MPKCNSMADIMMECSKLTQLNQGWHFLPADDPEGAVFGMTGFRRVDPNGNFLPDGKTVLHEQEETVLFEWMPYGQRLEPTEIIAQSIEQFRTLVNDLRPRGIFRCDAPRKIMVGFVGYDGVKGTSTVVRIPLTLTKEMQENDPFRMEIVIGSSRHMRYF